MNIKTAFLQSKQLDRLVNLDPLKEANVPPGDIWKLSKCVYGLADASKSWYLTLREELMKSGAVTSKYDQAIFTWHSGNKPQGIIEAHVDDFCFGGSEIFQSRVIDRLHHVFAVKSEDIAEFQYVGLDIWEYKTRPEWICKEIKIYSSRSRQEPERYHFLNRNYWNQTSYWPT